MFRFERDFKTCGNSCVVDPELHALNSTKTVMFLACGPDEGEICHCRSGYFRTINEPAARAVNYKVYFKILVVDYLDHLNRNGSVSVKLNCNLRTVCELFKVSRNVAPAL